MRIRSLRGLDHTERVRTWLGIGDVLVNTSREQVRLLKHNAKLAPQIVELDLAHFNAIHQNTTFIWVVEAGNQVDNRRLTGTRMSHQANHLTRLDIKTEVIQHSARLVIAKANLLKGDRTRNMRHRLRIRSICDIGLGVHNFKHTLGAGQGPRKPVRNARHPLKWSIQLPKIKEEQVERPEGHRSLDDLTATHIPDDENTGHHQEREHWEQRRPPVLKIKIDTQQVCRTGQEAVILTVFRRKCLDDTRTGNRRVRS